jgi:hypothetical protein
VAVTGRQPIEDHQIVECERCGRHLARSAALFRQNGRDGSRRVCRTCAFTDATMLRRSLRIAVIIGSVLLVINQGDVLAAGLWPPALAWKIPLTYLVPFIVATWSALTNGRIR